MRMSFEDEINRLKEEIERAEREITDLVGAQSSRVSDLERRFESVPDQDQLWAIFNELKNLKHQIKGEAMKARHSLKHSLHEAKDKVRAGGYEGASGEYAEEMYDRLEELGDYLGDRFDEIGESFTERVEEVSERVREKIRNLRHAGRAFHVEVPYNVHVPAVTVPEIRVPEIKIPDFGKVFSESFSKAWTGVPSAIVSSVRLPQADLGLIDTLANAGIFKSRNEGIAFFAHRGIEASEDWLTKVKEKLADIKKLQEETKREIEKVTGVSTTTTTPSPAPSPTPKSEEEDEEEEEEEEEGEAQ